MLPLIVVFDTLDTRVDATNLITNATNLIINKTTHTRPWCLHRHHQLHHHLRIDIDRAEPPLNGVSTAHQCYHQTQVSGARPLTDDTFGAVPVSHATHALLPIHILALAANALGLRLSPKKTFGTSPKLEVLGVEIDTVAQTAGITDDRHHCILAQCHSLLQRRSADLLDMQRIAGLLQFVSQVFPCGKAFLRCLYDTTRHALPGKRRLTRPARSELIWWCDILECWSGTSVFSPLPLMAAHIWTDACPRGYGGYLGLNTSPTAVFAKTIPHRHRRKNIRFLEALAVLEALQRFLPLWLGPTCHGPECTGSKKAVGSYGRSIGVRDQADPQKSRPWQAMV
ncbi:uncharacterized protein UHOD_11267 [Ustilago sp. UG-2017b]|nr:uncharacterized protein UHOD_11267 [Ustilago sp. UG-2017b]